ncbi:type III pantothenate kinase [Acidiphilium acidophilum]|uniref:Type III pantothenate kinase n=1 Tax=Acidiphilium acidophilum TaxID=76588 RepID=A0AAW9DPM3_ACIAO|nr:type III pantothenate kinase [Acidiphilium acidophilum]MDX5930690.1 type III pantothenate kinase [Acidiphilium acidophilum]
MRLVIDAGNTNIVFAVHDGSAWRGTWRIATDAQRTSDEYGVWLGFLLDRNGIAIASLHDAVIGTVVPAALYHLRRLCRDWFGIEPLIANATLDWGFAIKVDNPHEVGADRLLNALAAHQTYAGPLIVVDFGTATTFDVVDETGAYVGGAIAPGINLSVEALHQAAARLPRIGIGRPQRVIGTSTIPAMRSGIYWGYVGLVEGLITRIENEFGARMKVIATGGLAPLIAEGSARIERTDPDLTLEGLRLLSLRNPSPPLRNREPDND